MKIAFIDLEDTVIEPVLAGWKATELCGNFRKVKTVLDQWEPDEVRVFSFAIRDSAEAAEFVRDTQGMVERTIGWKIGKVHSTDDDIFRAVCNDLKLHQEHVSFSDVSEFLGKGGAFRHFVRQLAVNREGMAAEGMEVMLLDDAVMSERFEWPSVKVRGLIVNVDEAVDWVLQG